MLRKIILAVLLSIFLAPTLSAQITIQGQTQLCQNSMETYTLQATPSCGTYLWSVSGGSIIGSVGGTSVTVLWNGTAGSQGSVSAQGSKCGTNEINLFSPVTYVTIYAAPPPPYISGNFNVECNYTGPLTYTASAVEGATEYVWTLPSGWSGQASGQTITVYPNAAGGGTISVYAKVKCAQSTSLNSVNIGRSTPTLGAISGGAGCFCSGQTQSFSVPTVSGATSYQWSASGSLYIAGGNGTNTVSVGTSGSGGNITCYAVTACGNTNTVSAYIPTSASAPSTPTLTLVGSSPCTDYRREGTLLITNADPCATYYWSGDAGVVVSGSGSSAAVGVPYSGLNAYVYGVNACGTSASGSRNIPATPNCGGGQLRVAALSLNAAPNPFSDRTTLSYTLADDATVNLEVTTPVGKRITTLVNERQKAGDHNVVFDGSRLPTGVYIATLTVTAPSGDRQTASVQLTVTR